MPEKMSAKITDNMAKHAREILNLKKNFIDTYKTDSAKADEIYKEMRKTHGCARYDDAVYMLSLVKDNEPSKIPDEAWIDLSRNVTFLDIMHGCIRTCDDVKIKSKVNSDKNKLNVSDKNKIIVSNKNKMTSDTSVLNLSDELNTVSDNMKGGDLTQTLQQLTNLTNQGQTAVNSLSESAQKFLDIFANKAQTTGTQAVQNIQPTVDQAKQTVATATSNAQKALNAASKKTASSVTQTQEAVNTATKKSQEAIKQGQQAVDQAKKTVGQAQQSVASAASQTQETVDTAAAQIQNLINSVTKQAQPILNSITKATTNTAVTGGDGVNALQQATSALNQAQNLVNTATAQTKSAIDSVSKLTTPTKMKAVIKKAADEDIDEISVQNIQTESISKPRRNSESKKNVDVKNKNRTSSAKNSENTTEFLNNLTTDEAEEMYNNYRQNGGGDVNSEKEVLDKKKPTLVNYWGDWCPMSIAFKPEWEKFEKIAASKYPDLQIININVKKDSPELAELAKKVGVTGYPTIVLFKDGKTYTRPGKTTAENVEAFVKSKL